MSESTKERMNSAEMLSADDGKDSRPQKNRSVSLLTPEQLKRKRAQDRASQRQTRYAAIPSCIRRHDNVYRERVKGMIKELEVQVESLTKQLEESKLENAALQSKSLVSQPWLQSNERRSSPSRQSDFYGSPQSSVELIPRGASLSPRYSEILTNTYPEPFSFESAISTGI